MMKIITFAGFGGQGIIKISVLLGEAAIIEGKYALHNPTYGPQSRGGISKGDVIIADGPIYEIDPEEVDVLVTLSQQAFDKYISTIKENGILIIDSDLVKIPSNLKKVDLSKIPATKLAADRFGNRLITGTIALGCMAAKTNVVKKETLINMLTKNMSKESKDANIEAFEHGWNLGKEK